MSSYFVHEVLLTIVCCCNFYPLDIYSYPCRMNYISQAVREMHLAQAPKKHLWKYILMLVMTINTQLDHSLAQPVSWMTTKTFPRSNLVNNIIITLGSLSVPPFPDHAPLSRCVVTQDKFYCIYNNEVTVTPSRNFKTCIPMHMINRPVSIPCTFLCW